MVAFSSQFNGTADLQDLFANPPTTASGSNEPDLIGATAAAAAVTMVTGSDQNDSGELKQDDEKRGEEEEVEEERGQPEREPLKPAEGQQQGDPPSNDPPAAPKPPTPAPPRRW